MKGGEEGQSSPGFPADSPQDRAEEWKISLMLTVTHFATVSLSGTHMAESNKLVPIPSPLAVLAASSVQASSCALSFAHSDSSKGICTCGLPCNTLLPSFCS